MVRLCFLLSLFFPLQALQGVTLKLKGEVYLTNGWASHRVRFTVAELQLADKLDAGQSLAVKPVEFAGLMVSKLV